MRSLRFLDVLLAARVDSSRPVQSEAHKATIKQPTWAKQTASLPAPSGGGGGRGVDSETSVTGQFDCGILAKALEYPIV